MRADGLRAGERRRIPDTTTWRKPPQFGRTIAFMGIGIPRA